MSWPFAPTQAPESQRPDICRIVFYLTGAPCTNLIDVHTRGLPLIGKWGVKPSSWDAPLWADVRRRALAGNWAGGGGGVSSCKARGECTAGAPELEGGASLQPSPPAGLADGLLCAQTRHEQTARGWRRVVENAMSRLKRSSLEEVTESVSKTFYYHFYFFQLRRLTILHNVYVRVRKPL